MKLVSPLPNHLLTQASELYAEAFAHKAVWVIGPQKLFASLLVQSLNPNYAIGVIDESGHLLGVAGFKANNSSFLNINKELFRNNFPLLSSKVRYLFSRLLFNRWGKKGELLMDGIAVHSSFRGKGVGTLLMNGIIAKAQELNMSQIRLDVIDENPRAKMLYERLGFRTIRHMRTPFIKKWTGISGVSTMIKIID